MPDSNAFSEEELQVLLPLFVSSGRGTLAIVQDVLDSVRFEQVADDAQLEVIHRSIHSLKGAAMQLGILHIGTLAVAFEAAASAAHGASCTPSPEEIDLMERGIARLGEYLGCVERAEDLPEPPADLLGEFHQLAERWTEGGTQQKAMGD